MIDICFVILNYNLFEEAIDCAASIRDNIDTDNWKIIIVDNGSPNGAGELLKKHFFENEKVEVILLQENIGFARGNNIGIERARSEEAENICCINNDARLLSTDFFSTIKERYLRYKPALIGPKIVYDDGSIDTFTHRFRPIDEYTKRLEHDKAETYEEYCNDRYTLKHRIRKHIDKYKFSRKIFRSLKTTINGIDPYKYDLPDTDSEIPDVVISGCCLIFTPIFFDYLSGFNDRTFLYWEEEFLQADLIMHGLHSLYIPDIHILHKGSKSTSDLNNQNAEKEWEFFKYHSTRSLTLFVNYLHEHETEIYRHA